MSPDAIAQLIKQLAFHRMFGRPGVTYESAQTRKYQLGRTEVIRSASKESKAWAEAMLDPKLRVRLRFLNPWKFKLKPHLFFQERQSPPYVIFSSCTSTCSIRNMGN